MDGARALYDGADLAGATLHVALRDRNAFNDDPLFTRQSAHHDAGLAFVLARNHFYFVSFFDFHKS